MLITNKANLSQPLVDAVLNDGYSRGNSDISVTQLIDPPRKVELIRRHDDKLEEDVSDRIFALFGQAIHTILERADRTGDVENRLYATVGPWTVSGQFDRVALIEDVEGKHVLQDYKTAKVGELMRGVKAERELQLNCLAYLARLHGYSVDKLEAIFILRDWSKVRAAKDPTYPQKQVEVVELPLWPAWRAAMYMTERTALHRNVREGTIPLPDCTDEERWASPEKFAVKKPNTKRALRLFDTEEAALEYIVTEKKAKGAYVEHRPGENIRCAFYCAAAPVCDQWQAIKTDGEDEADG